ncbi:MAG: UDP-N-acetylmuramoyl-L-alanine--D-glutamate ligase [Verrucomicrobiales bacterium]|nr:UDP-N-acetylmuramoyl-L-alanine--D-glutamate ligase [Verrucomicrobiales bacterium]
MSSYEKQKVLVIGLGMSGQSAATFLRQRGADVWAIDSADTAELRATAERLGKDGIRVLLGASDLAESGFELGVVSPGVPGDLPCLGRLRSAGVPVIGELELGYRESLCLNIAITGTDGKTTTTRLIERVLSNSHKRTIAAGNIGTPITSVVDRTRDLDFLTLEVSSFQLESIQYFRSTVAVLLNLAPDHLDRHRSMEAYIRAKGRLFENQQAFDWAIVQSEALAQLRALGIEPRGKIITFSATDSQADLFLDRSLLISRLPLWEGPLLDLEKCKLSGPHNAENCMAALAVGRVLRLPLEETIAAVRDFVPLPHRCELLREVNGVRFINDSKATTMHALEAALRAIPMATGGRPNVWLIAGGKDKGLDYHQVGPLLHERVKGTYLIGETATRLRSDWGLFTPCSVCGSLLEAVSEAARRAEPGDVVLLSPACSSFDQFRDYQHRGEVFRQAVLALALA